MLSKIDIYRELGRNIYLYPLKTENIRDNSIDLTASELAWTSDKQYIYSDDGGKIIVPPHKTACILTEEAIYVSKKIGGTFHSRVSLSRQGFGHIGTMIDPEFFGRLLIMLHNISDTELIIKKGQSIVSLVFYHLETPIKESSANFSPGNTDIVSGLDNTGRYDEWRRKNQWIDSKQGIIDQFNKDCAATVKEKRKKQQKERSFLVRIWGSKAGRMAIKYIIAILLSVAAFICINQFHGPDSPLNWEAIIIPVILCFIGLISSDIEKNH